MSSRPIVAIIGRPNVGKSTLFNRLIGRRQAIVSAVAGTTRDRHFGVAEWFGRVWTVVDTAGLLIDNEASLALRQLARSMRQQAEAAIDEADAILFVTDAAAGLRSEDEAIIRRLRATQKPVVVVANKADNPSLRALSAVFSRLGVAAVFAVSAIHGTGVGDLTTWLGRHVPPAARTTEPTEPKVAVVGRPNVGKSSLINRLVGVDRLVVSDVPGTTRDAVGTPWQFADRRRAILIDTGGVRRRGQVAIGLEKYAFWRTIAAIGEADAVVVVMTIEEPPTRGDAHIADFALEGGKKVLIVLNKSDLAAQPIFRLNDKQQAKLAVKFLRRFPFMTRLPVVFASAQSGQGLESLRLALTAALAPIDHKM